MQITVFQLNNSKQAFQFSTLQSKLGAASEKQYRRPGIGHPHVRVAKN